MMKQPLARGVASEPAEEPLHFRRTGLDFGPVLDPRDAVGAKVSALWSRSKARDDIDTDTMVDSGRFSRDDVLTFADQFEATALEWTPLGARLRDARGHNEAAFARYGVDAVRRATVLASFAEWADEIDPPSILGIDR